MIIIFCMLLLATHRSYADTCSGLKVRAAAFVPSSQLFRTIYGKVSASMQLEATTQVCDCVDFWANLDFFAKHGKSVGLRQKTKIKIATFSTGVKLIGNKDRCLQTYLGIGPSFAGVWLKNCSTCPGCTHAEAVSPGVVFKFGCSRTIYGCGLLDLFADYTYQPAHFNRWKNVGGLKFGIGLGGTW